MTTTPKEIKDARAKAKMTQDAIAADFDLSVRFWRNRELGVRAIPRWLHYAVIGFLHEHGLFVEKEKLTTGTTCLMKNPRQAIQQAETKETSR